MKIVFDIYKKYFMNHLKIFINLTRLNKPIGFMLLFWPCSWGLGFAYTLNQDLALFLNYIFLFFLGSILMRSAGCIFNDIVDKDYDKRVLRTKQRPIASGKISVNTALFYVVFLCAIAFVILIQFNTLTIVLGLGSMFLAFSYPFMKRLTYWPQLFLGFTFNWGIIMAWAAMTNSLTSEIFLLYLAAIFWTLGYDTIYGAQDVVDDEIIGLKSTSIKFKKHLKKFVTISYSITSAVIIFLFSDKLGINFFTIMLTIFILSLIYQIIKLNKKNSKTFLECFKINNYSGLVLFLAIMMI